mgnify:CR=1 FL=1
MYSIDWELKIIKYQGLDPNKNEEKDKMSRNLSLGRGLNSSGFSYSLFSSSDSWEGELSILTDTYDVARKDSSGVDAIVPLTLMLLKNFLCVLIQYQEGWNE